MVIIAFAGSTVPNGWLLCNGSNGTPDLRNRFVYGASVNSDVRTTGGAATHTHTMPSTGSGGNHNHGSRTRTTSASTTNDRQQYINNTDAAAHGHTHSASVGTGDSGTHTHSVGSTGSHSSIPSCVTRMFIMKA